MSSRVFAFSEFLAARRRRQLEELVAEASVRRATRESTRRLTAREIQHRSQMLRHLATR